MLIEKAGRDTSHINVLLKYVDYISNSEKIID